MSAWYPLIFVGLMGLAMLIYVVLDGYDLGVGILLRGADDADKDTMIASIGPFWDANETWLVLGIGILLAAFPVAHGMVLGALYLPVEQRVLRRVLESHGQELAHHELDVVGQLAARHAHDEGRVVGTEGLARRERDPHALARFLALERVLQRGRQVLVALDVLDGVGSVGALDGRALRVEQAAAQLDARPAGDPGGAHREGSCGSTRSGVIRYV